jgi:hypothetical protein
MPKKGKKKTSTERKSDGPERPPSVGFKQPFRTLPRPKR